MKKLIILFLVSILLLSACTSNETSSVDKNISTNEDKVMIELTIDELAAFNGKNGQPAYVAHDGIIYDVTDVNAWKQGEHNGQLAGTDITEAIKKAPHGVKNLKLAVEVGKIKE
jgi:predicted heme/steroid binding protein